MNPMSTEQTSGLPQYPEQGKKSWRVGTLVYTSGGLVTLFGWLLWGDFSYQLRDRALNSIFPKLLHNFGASDTMVASLTSSAAALIVIILTPIFSYLSDRHRGRLGRRIPFLLGIIPISVLAMVGLAYSPLLGKTNANILKFFAFFIVLFTACDTICNLIFLGLCNDVVPRGVIGRFFGLFRVVSLGAGILFSSFLMPYILVHFTLIVLCMAAIYGVGFTATCMMVREGEYPPPEHAPTPFTATLIYLRDCFSSPYYRWIFLSIALANMAQVPFNTYLLIWATQMGMSLRMFGMAQSAQFMLSLIQSYPLGWLADKVHPIRLTLCSMIFYAVASLLSYKLVHTPLQLAVASVFIGTSSGWWLTANGPFCMSLFPKIEFAQFYAAAGMASSAGMLLVAFLCGRFLDKANHHYRYILLWMAVLAVFSFVATWIVYRKFIKLGGFKSYVAPLPGTPNETL
jgi:maltose/moltooligosaccharide transporter